MRDYTYAQERRGQKLHLVERFDGRHVSYRALCGRESAWRMTINVPMGMSCGNCRRIHRAVYGREYAPMIGVTINV